MSRSKKIFLIIFSLLGINFLLGGTFWAGKKAGERKAQLFSTKSALEQQTEQIQNQLLTARQQLARAADSDQKQKLEQIIKQLEQEQMDLLKKLPPSYSPTPEPKNEKKIVYRESNSTFALFDDLMGSFLPNQKSENFQISIQPPLIKKLRTI